jgi:hypothetical protein
MSDHPKGLASGVAHGVADEFAKHQAATPANKASNGGYIGTGLLAASGYYFLEGDLSGISTEVEIGLAVAAGLGLLLLMSAWKTRSQRDYIAAFLAAAFPIGGLYVIYGTMPDLLTDFWVRGAVITICCANLVRFWLAIRGPGSGSAEKQVRRQIQQHEFRFKAAKPH